MARTRRKAAADVQSSRYTVSHAFNFTDADGVDHWITAGSAEKLALLSKDMLAEKIAAGHVIDHESGQTTGEDAE